jgi:hypothetical protein
MIFLKQHLDSMNFSNFENANNLLKNANVKTSFWGSRLIEINGYTGSVKIDDIAKKFIEAMSPCFDSKNDSRNINKMVYSCSLSGRERIGGLNTLSTIKKFYKLSDTQISNSNIIKKFSICFFKALRELMGYILPITSIKDQLADITPSSFLYYTKESYKREFGSEPENDSIPFGFIKDDKSNSYLKYFHIKEDLLRTKYGVDS